VALYASSVAAGFEARWDNFRAYESRWAKRLTRGQRALTWRLTPAGVGPKLLRSGS